MDNTMGDNAVENSMGNFNDKRAEEMNPFQSAPDVSMNRKGNNRYKEFNGHKIGFSHVNKGSKCEDYSLSYSNGMFTLAVISDGHGDKKAFRSEIGSKLACLSVKEVLEDTFVDDLSVTVLTYAPDRVILEIEKAIIYRWNAKVLQHLGENPILEEELAGFDPEVVQMYRMGNRSQKAYGCTLIATVVFRDIWFGIQVGDGKCIVIKKNGVYYDPIPVDEKCIGNRSTSLCGSQAFADFRYCFQLASQCPPDDYPVAFFVMSDGVEESFDENGLNKCLYTVSYLAKNKKKEEFYGELDKLLDKISRGGSGDDVSLSLIVDMNEEISQPYATSAQIAEVMRNVYHNLLDLENEYKDLIHKKDDYQSKISKLQEEILELKNKIEENESAIEQKKTEVSDQTKSFLRAKEAKKNVDEFWMAKSVPIVYDEEVMNYIPYLTQLEQKKHPFVKVEESEPEKKEIKTETKSEINAEINPENKAEISDENKFESSKPAGSDTQYKEEKQFKNANPYEAAKGYGEGNDYANGEQDEPVTQYGTGEQYGDAAPYEPVTQYNTDDQYGNDTQYNDAVKYDNEAQADAGIHFNNTEKPYEADSPYGTQDKMKFEQERLPEFESKKFESKEYESKEFNSQEFDSGKKTEKQVDDQAPGWKDISDEDKTDPPHFGPRDSKKSY